MNHAGLKKMLAVGVAIFGLSLFSAQADAGWWWGGAPCCSSGCSYYGGCGYGCGYGCGWGYGHGCGCHHAYRSCGYGCGCDYGSYLGCDTCGASVGYWGSPVVSSCGCGGMVIGGTTIAAPVEGSSMPTPAVAAPKPSAAPPEKPISPPLGTPSTSQPVLPDGGGIVPPVPSRTSLESMTGDSGLLTIWVPNEAKVTINGMLTKSTGSKRHFVSYGLRPGYSYEYKVKAEIVRDGEVLVEEQTISLKAGGQNGVAFGFNKPNPEGLAQAN